MNLFELLANFWRIDEQQNFSGNETRLFFFLVQMANRSFWPEWIEYSDKKMVANVDFSLQVLKSARERLKSSGLEWKENIGKKEHHINLVFTGENPLDKTDWNNQHKLLSDWTERFYNYFKDKIKTI